MLSPLPRVDTTAVDHDMPDDYVFALIGEDDGRRVLFGTQVAYATVDTREWDGGTALDAATGPVTDRGFEVIATHYADDCTRRDDGTYTVSWTDWETDAADSVVLDVAVDGVIIVGRGSRIRC